MAGIIRTLGGGNGSNMVDQRVGDAYWVVNEVYKNLAELKQISEGFNEFDVNAAAAIAAKDAAEVDAIQTAADRVQTALDVITTTAQAVIATTQAGLATTNGEAQVDLAEAQVALATAKAVLTAADRVQTGLDVIATAADRVQTGLYLADVQAAVSAGVGSLAVQTLAALNAITTAPTSSLGYVTNDSTSTNNGLYQWNGTVWTKSIYDPLTQGKAYTNRVINTNFNTGLEVTYEDGFSLENDSIFAGIRDKSIDTMIKKDSAWTGFEAIYDDGFSAMPSDETYTPNPPPIDITTTSGYLKIFNVREGIIGTATYGQSLSNGASTGSSISLSQPYANLMLSGGINKKPGTGYISNSFSPLMESGADETPVSGFVNSVTESIMRSGYLATDVVLSGLGAGVNGRKIEELSKGTIHYTNLIKMISDNHSTAVANGKKYALHFVQWKQGEAQYLANATNGKTADIEYSQALQKLISDVYLDTLGITKQTFHPIWIISQVCSHKAYNRNSQFVSLGLLKTSEALPNVYLSYPDYFIPKVSDGVHMTAAGSWLSGAYDAMVASELMNGKEWKPFHIKGVSWQENILILDCHVPVAPIQFSTLDCKQAPNQGFDIWEDDVLADIITSVEIIGDMKDKIKITCSRPPSSGATLKVAFGRAGDQATNNPLLSGAVTNVHDSNSRTVTDQNNTTYTLRNYLVVNQFKKEI